MQIVGQIAQADGQGNRLSTVVVCLGRGLLSGGASGDHLLHFGVTNVVNALALERSSATRETTQKLDARIWIFKLKKIRVLLNGGFIQTVRMDEENGTGSFRSIQPIQQSILR